jgi:putative ABC transport system permease protein
MIGAPAPEGRGADGEGERQVFLTWAVAPDFFDVLGLPISQGRAFREGEGRAGEEDVVILNEEIARRYFPDGDAVGRRLLIDEEGYRIVGVAGSVNLPELAKSPLRDMQLFFPFSQKISDGFTIIARVPGDRTAAVGRLKEAVWDLDRSLPVQDISMLEEALADSLSQERSNALLMILFGITSLVLGALGIYGVMAYSVNRRIREMGIRLALGASRRGVVRRVVMGGMGAVVVGMGLGALVAIFLGSAVSDLLVDVDPRDPAVFLSVLLLTAVVALIATWVPARRAAGAGPLDALRSD